MRFSSIELRSSFSNYLLQLSVLPCFLKTVLRKTQISFQYIPIKTKPISISMPVINSIVIFFKPNSDCDEVKRYLLIGGDG